MIVSRAVVVAIEKCSGRDDVVDYAGPVEARFAAIVARVVEKRAMLLIEFEIQTRRLRIECIAARLRTNEIVSRLRVARTVRQRIERQVVARNRTDSFRRNEVVGKCSALNAIAGALRRKRIENLYAERQQRRKISSAFGHGRNRELRRFRKRVL